MKQPVFRGSCTAIVTPFTAERIDPVRMGKLLDFQAENGTKAIVVAGTTGEAATLEIHEYESLVDLSVAHEAGRMKIIVGVGGNDTARCAEKARFASRIGADAVLLTAPYYNKTTQQGLIAHFSRVADASEVPLILYNVPSRTGIGIAAETYRALAAHPNINGVKEASGDFTLIGRVASECAGALNLWSGNDSDTLPMIALGAQGVVSVASNLVPGAVEQLCELCFANNYPAARSLFQQLAPLFRALFLETNPIPVKTALALLGRDSGELRLPLVPMAPDHLEKLKNCLMASGLLP